MLYRKAICAIALTALSMSIGSVQAADDSKYPDWTGAWGRFIVRGLGGQPTFDQTKPWGRGQQAPLTPEYQAIFEASLADQAKGALVVVGQDQHDALREIGIDKAGLSDQKRTGKRHGDDTRASP